MSDEDKITEEKSKVLEFAKKYASRQGYEINSDDKIADVVMEGLARNKVKHGRRYCPCRPLSGDYEIDKHKICPCKWHSEEIARDGHCHCALFYAKKQHGG